VSVLLILYYWITAVVGNGDRTLGTKVSSIDDVQGYVFSYLLDVFILPHVKNGTFYFIDLKYDITNAGVIKDFNAITAATNARLKKYKESELLDTEMLSSYFFKKKSLEYYDAQTTNQGDGNESHQDGGSDEQGDEQSEDEVASSGGN